MDDFKRNIQGFRKAGGRRGSKHHAGGRGGPCSCCTEADKRTRSRLARHRSADKDRRSRESNDEVTTVDPTG